MTLNLEDKVYALEIDLNQLYANKRLRAKIGCLLYTSDAADE